MPLKLNIGLSRKLGLPSYGSVGASCAVEVELDPLFLHDAESMQQRVDEAFDVCRVAVEHELKRYQPPEAPPAPAGPATGPSTGTLASEPSVEPDHAGPVAAQDTAGSLATSRQIEFAYCLARQIRSLGGQRLKLLAQEYFGRSLEELTTLEASRLIDLLKDVRAGTRSVDDFLTGAAA